MNDKYTLTGGPLGGEVVAFSGPETKLPVPDSKKLAAYELRTTEDEFTGERLTQAVFVGMVSA